MQCHHCYRVSASLRRDDPGRFRNRMELEFQDDRRFHSNSATSVEGGIYYYSIACIAYWQLEQCGSYTQNTQTWNLSTWYGYNIHGPLRPLHSTPTNRWRSLRTRRLASWKQQNQQSNCFGIQFKMRLRCPSMLFYNVHLHGPGLDLREPLFLQTFFSAGAGSLCEGHVVRPVESRRLGKGFFIAARRKETWFVSGPHFSFAVADTN